jgi:hypothetical protein
MPQQPSTSKRLRCALLAACGAALLVTANVGFARAGDDDEEDVPYDTKIFRNLMSGLGLKRDGEGPGIDYRERSPLVVPPSRDLPPPEAAMPAPKAANWPVDPDEKRRKEAIAARKKAANTRYQVEDEGRALSPKDLTPGAASAGRQPTPQSGRGDGKEAQAGDRLSVYDLGYKGDFFSWNSLFGKDKGDVAKFQAEPPRASLTEPPVGYRTPSSAQPYGLNPEANAGPRKPMDIFDRQTPADASGKQ